MNLKKLLLRLHRLLGLPSGLFLVIFAVTGCFALYPGALQIPRTAFQAPSAQAITSAVEMRSAESVNRPFIKLPDEFDPCIRILHYDGNAFRGPALDAQSGREIKNADPPVGFLVALHSRLLFSPFWGAILAIAATLIVLIELISGAAGHFKLAMRNFLTVPLNASPPRNALNWHLCFGTVLGGFLLASAVAVLVLSFEALMPVGVSAPVPHSTEPWHAQDYVNLYRNSPLKDRDKGFFISDPDRLRLYASDRHGFFLTRPYSEITRENPKSVFYEPPKTLRSFFYGIHDARWCDPITRALYCVFGIGCAFIAGTGLLIRARKEQSKPLASWLIAQCLFGLPVCLLLLVETDALIRPSPSLLGLYLTVAGIINALILKFLNFQNAITIGRTALILSLVVFDLNLDTDIVCRGLAIAMIAFTILRKIRS